MAAYIHRLREMVAVTESTNERAGDYHSLIRLTVDTEGSVHSIAGTLFSNNKPRIVEVDGIAVEAELAPHMLFVTNDDKPGFIGALGTTLGGAGVNIATFHLGRTNAGGDAMALIEVDGRVPEPVLDAVRRLPLVRQAKGLHFAGPRNGARAA